MYCVNSIDRRYKCKKGEKKKKEGPPHLAPHRDGHIFNEPTRERSVNF